MTQHVHEEVAKDQPPIVREQVTEYVCAMPDSYQNFEVIDVPDVEVKAGDKFAFSVNDPECVCHFVLDCWAAASLWPAPEPEVPPEPQEDMPAQEV